jgi:hypothetical protein
MKRGLQYFVFAIALTFAWTLAHAEPYLATFEGMKCAQCHVNPTGGGLRTVYGNVYAQSQLAASHIDTGDTVWTGVIGSMLAVGANLRADATVTQIPHQPETSAFELSQARLYVNVAVVPNRLSVYLDELVAPNAANNREAFVRYQSASDTWSIKAGQMYLPFGLRLQDNSAFIRQAPGINMNTPDSGVELDWEPGSWSTQLAVSNGSAGGAETDNGKQYSAQAAYVSRHWRAGTAVNFNDSDAGDRTAAGIFAGLNTGPIVWLGEIDYVQDQIVGGSDRKLIAGLIEGDWRVRQGHNLKLTWELLDPDTNVDNDRQTRISAVYEYTPIQFLQLRGGLRYYEGIPQNDLQNRRVYFVEMHGFY